MLNQISDDSGEFSYAVNCLRLLFEMLGMFSWVVPFFFFLFDVMFYFYDFCFRYVLRMQAVVEGYIVSKRYA